MSDEKLTVIDALMRLSQISGVLVGISMDTFRVDDELTCLVSPSYLQRTAGDIAKCADAIANHYQEEEDTSDG